MKVVDYEPNIVIAMSWSNEETDEALVNERDDDEGNWESFWESREWFLIVDTYSIFAKGVIEEPFRILCSQGSGRLFFYMEEFYRFPYGIDEIKRWFLSCNKYRDDRYSLWWLSIQSDGTIN